MSRPYIRLGKEDIAHATSEYQRAVDLLKAKCEDPVLLYRALATNAAIQIGLIANGDMKQTIQLPLLYPEDNGQGIVEMPETSVNDVLTALNMLSHAISRIHKDHPGLKSERRGYNDHYGPNIMYAGIDDMTGGFEGAVPFARFTMTMFGYTPNADMHPAEAVAIHNAATAWALGGPLGSNYRECAGLPDWILDEQQVPPELRIYAVQAVNTYLLTGKYDLPQE